MHSYLAVGFSRKSNCLLVIQRVRLVDRLAGDVHTELFEDVHIDVR